MTKIINYFPKQLWIFLGILTLIRIFVALNFDLGVDEAHYVLYGINLDLSYFDHPPLVGWMQALFIKLFGINLFSARIGAILTGFVTSLLLYHLIFKIFHDIKKAILAVLALNASFIFNALFLMFLPDTLLYILIFPIIFTTYNLEKNPTLKNWLLLGFFLGLAGLSKYTAVLFLPPIALYFLIKRRFNLFYDIKILPAIFLASIIILPVIIWNIEHNWISFNYQSNHVAGASHICFYCFFKSILAQFGAYNPFLMPIAFYGLYKSFKSKNDLLLLVALFGTVLILFFSYSSLYKTALPHWSSEFYLLFIPIGVVFLYDKFKKYIHFAIGFGFGLSLIIYAELSFKFIPQKNYNSIHRDIYGWSKILKEANSFIKDKNKDAIAVTNWSLASRAIYYNLKYKTDIFLLDNRFDQFDLWQKKSPIGKNLIIIQTKFFHKNLNDFKCKSIKKLKTFDIKINNYKVNTINLIKCYNYQGLK